MRAAGSLFPVGVPLEARTRNTALRSTAVKGVAEATVPYVG